MLIGTLEKVGIIPLAVTGYLTAKKLLSDQTIQFFGIEWIFAFFIALYLLAIYMLSAAHQIDRIVLVLKQAVNTSNG